jgi:hypothetical protein
MVDLQHEDSLFRDAEHHIEGQIKGYQDIRNQYRIQREAAQRRFQERYSVAQREVQRAQSNVEHLKNDHETEIGKLAGEYRRTLKAYWSAGLDNVDNMVSLISYQLRTQSNWCEVTTDTVTR